MGGPGGSFGGFDVNEYADAWGCEWGAVVIEETMDLGVRGKVGIDA